MIKGLTFHITEDRVLFSFSSSLVCTETDLTGGLKEPPTHSLTDSLTEIYHPDRLRGEASSEVESAVKKFLEVDAAWRILSDQDTRRQYDLQRRAQELKQDWPVDCTVCLDDMTWDQDECVYTYSCRCGGGFIVSEEETQRRQQDDEQEGTEEGEHRGVVVCCDTCSLSVYVTWGKGNNIPHVSCGHTERFEFSDVPELETETYSVVRRTREHLRLCVQHLHDHCSWAHEAKHHNMSKRADSLKADCTYSMKQFEVCEGDIA
ncbi:Zinc finger-containing protein 3 [Collichthys lucidus]|uniref:Zinc finger-containing protein 3 n=1 Tax=Collichthys lucidus TaxID=240159 RepID=A0A4U5UIF5_COLLU|nr:Zinc finger-containing protein 3 [Collichthys lucidus]